jgi:hypothetical protein
MEDSSSSDGWIKKNAVFWDVTPRGSFNNQEPHGVISQKTAILVVTAVENLKILDG